MIGQDSTEQNCVEKCKVLQCRVGTGLLSAAKGKAGAGLAKWGLWQILGDLVRGIYMCMGDVSTKW